MLLNYYCRQAVAQYAQTCKTKQEDNKMKKLVALAMSLTMAFSDYGILSGSLWKL